MWTSNAVTNWIMEKRHHESLPSDGPNDQENDQDRKTSSNNNRVSLPPTSHSTSTGLFSKIRLPSFKANSFDKTTTTSFHETPPKISDDKNNKKKRSPNSSSPSTSSSKSSSRSNSPSCRRSDQSTALASEAGYGMPDMPNAVIRKYRHGVEFKGKLIGSDTVAAAKGDNMCHTALAKLKAAVLIAKQHKPPIFVRVTDKEIRLLDFATKVCWLFFYFKKILKPFF